MKNLCILLLTVISLAACRTIPKSNSDSVADNTAPDYSDLDNWAASPFKVDMADKIPGSDNISNLKEAAVDIFFIHPTTHTKKRDNHIWNASIKNLELNEKTDNGTILFQSSVFNKTGRVFAPRYRQAHIRVFYKNEEEFVNRNEKALALAYQDIKNAFEFYLENHNDGRAIIIASHSQGTLHAGRLISEFFEGKPLMKKLVAAYLIGMPVRADSFAELKKCENETQTTCFVSWRSYQRNYLPNYHEKGSNIVVTNPLSWKTDNEYVSKEENKGTVLFKFEDGLHPDLADAQVHEDFLWVTKPKFKGSIFITFKNYHIADYNLFYKNIQENALLRASTYLENIGE